MAYHYQPLADYLAGLPPETAEVTLTFPEIEAIVGEPLPRASRLSAWWSPDYGPHAQRWRATGWRIARLARRTNPPTATFVRVGSTA